MTGNALPNAIYSITRAFKKIYKEANSFQRLPAVQAVYQLKLESMYNLLILLFPERGRETRQHVSMYACTMQHSIRM